MAHLTDLDLTAPADSLFSGGTVLNTWRTRIDVLNDALGDITSVEADQVENLGTTTISAAQWVYLGALDQSIISTASVDFGEVDITKTTTLAAGGFGLRSQVTHSTTGMTGTLRGAYIVATNAPFTATGAIRGAEIKARAATSGDVGGNVTTLEGVSISCDAKNKTVTTQRGMEVILDGKSGAAVTLGVGIRIANNYQANIATTSYALQIYRDSFDYTADIQLSGGGLIGGSTGKIKMDSSGVTTLTASGNLDIGAYNLRAATLTADGLTATRVIFAGASGLLSDSAAMTFITDTLTVTKIAAFTLMGKLTAGAVEIEGSAFDINGGTIASVTLDGAIAGGDQAFTGVGDMTFTAGSLLRSGVTGADTLLLAANDTTFITLTTGAPDTLGIGAFTLSGKLTGGASEIEGSAFDINGGTIASVTLDGAIAGGDQVFTNVGDMTFAAGSILKSGSTNTNTLLLAANDTTFITFTTADPDTCAISGAAIDSCIIGAGTPAALTCTTFTSTGIDDNADATAITISVDEVVSLGAAKLTVGATTPTAAQWGFLGALTTNPIGGDGTAGIIFRMGYVIIANGTDDQTLKCTVGSFWNGDTIAETNNVAKNATTGDFSLNAAGTALTIEASGLTGNCIAGVGFLYKNATSIAYTALVQNDTNDIAIRLYNLAGTNVDLTTVVDAGEVRLEFLYITDA